jgi:hypothetical protein
LIKLRSIEIRLIWVRLMYLRLMGMGMGKGLRRVNEGLKGILILLIE